MRDSIIRPNEIASGTVARRTHRPWRRTNVLGQVLGVLATAALVAWLPESILARAWRGYSSASSNSHLWLEEGLLAAGALGLSRLALLSRGDIGLQFPVKPVNWSRLFLACVGAILVGAIAQIILGDTSANEYSPIDAVSGYWLVGFGAAMEELYCRGAVQGWLRRLLTRDEPAASGAWAPLLSATFFGLLHATWGLRGVPPGATLALVIYATALGVVFGIYRERSGSLLPGAAAHVAINLFVEWVNSLHRGAAPF
jgi:membrane protease YdiL (CAAX protease family)